MATYPNVNAANQYARDVVNGKILACRLTMLACQRHLDDLERAKDPHWPYRFDKNKAERFLRFSQKMPHTSGEWARRKLRIEFEPWQKFALGVPFGWVRKDTGFRRFTEIYIEVPRKMGNRRLRPPSVTICSVQMASTQRKFTVVPQRKNKPGKFLRLHWRW